MSNSLQVRQENSISRICFHCWGGAVGSREVNWMLRMLRWWVWGDKDRQRVSCLKLTGQTSKKMDSNPLLVCVTADLIQNKLFIYNFWTQSTTQWKLCLSALVECSLCDCSHQLELCSYPSIDKTTKEHKDVHQTPRKSQLNKHEELQHSNLSLACWQSVKETPTVWGKELKICREPPHQCYWLAASHASIQSLYTSTASER